MTNHLTATDEKVYLDGLRDMLATSLAFWESRDISAEADAAELEYELGRARERVAEVDERLAAIADDVEAERLAYTERLNAAHAREEAIRKAQASHYYGALARVSDAGKTHFENGWGETFCGTLSDWDLIPAGEGRAECERCRQAGDAAKRDGFAFRTGSPARRL